PTTGSIITVPAGGDFQAVLNTARPGDIIELQAGATYTGNFQLPNKIGTGWIYIRSSAHASLPSPGTRVSPTQAGLMARIVSPNNQPALYTAPSAHHYRLIGLEITMAAGVPTNYVLVQLDGGVTAALSDVPHDLVIDRCYLHGQPTAESFRAVVLNSAATAVI